MTQFRDEPTAGIDVTIPLRGLALHGALVVPPEARGLVIFAHASASGRLVRRNRALAGMLQAGDLATLQVDLLTPDEARAGGRTLPFDIALLTARLCGVTRWARAAASTERLAVGYIAEGTAAAAALAAAALLPDQVRAVVSEAGRPDLASRSLGGVRAPTLLIAGTRDPLLAELGRDARRRLGGPRQLALVPEASHRFEEPGALQQVAELAEDWFARHLPTPAWHGARATIG